MKPVLIIQLRPEDKAAESEFAAILRTARLNRSDVERLRGEAVPFGDLNLAKYSAIIVGGSPFDVTTPEDKKSDTQKRIEDDFRTIVSQIIKLDFPFIGACSGNGLLTMAAGGKMSKKYAEPVSGVDIFVTDEGRGDKLLAGFPSPFRALVGHKEACEVPPKEAKVLAYSNTCPTQMMRIGENVYATQFHPEADAAEFKLRIEIYKNYGYFKPEDAERLKAQVEGEDTKWAHEVLKRFADYYYRKQKLTLPSAV